jgi:hypothetical protein
LFISIHNRSAQETNLQKLSRYILILLAGVCPLCAQSVVRSVTTAQSTTTEGSSKLIEERLPDAPSATAAKEAEDQAQGQEGDDSKGRRSEYQTSEPTVQPSAVDAFSFGHLPMSLKKGPMTVGEKFSYFEKPIFGPRGIFTTAFQAGLSMANPPSGYPPEWRSGAGAFGRNYGNAYARNAAESLGRFSVDALLHEDPRYSRSTSKSFLGRSAHALTFTFFDKTDGGHRTLALGNFVGAGAAGFVGNAYLPDGWNNTTHAGQRSLTVFAGFAAQNLTQEFAPEIGRAFQWLHIPKLPLPPVWWKQ